MTINDLPAQKDDAAQEQNEAPRDKKSSVKLLSAALYSFSGSIAVLSAAWHVSTGIIGPAFFVSAVLLGYLVQNEPIKWCVALGTGLIAVAMFWYEDVTWIVTACFLLVGIVSVAAARSMIKADNLESEPSKN